VTVDTITLATHEWPGRGPAVVAIHGLTSNHTVWYPIADALGGSHRLIAYDLRGRGDSDKPRPATASPPRGGPPRPARPPRSRPRHPRGHSLGAHIGVRFATLHPSASPSSSCSTAGSTCAPKSWTPLAPAIGRLGVEFPSLEKFLEALKSLPMFQGRWNAYLARHYTYDVESGPGGGVRSKVAKHAIEEEVANLQRTRLWVWHHQIQAPTLLFRAPDGLLRAEDCLMTRRRRRRWPARSRAAAGRRSEHQPLHGRARREPRGAARARGLLAA